MRTMPLFALALVLAAPVSWLAAPVTAADVVGTSNEPLAVNDISWLFPMPEMPADLASAISLSDVNGPSATGTAGATPAWSDSAMKQYFAIVDKFGAVAGENFRIGLSERIRNRAVWHIAGVRIDPGAPGLSPEIVAQFGRQPQIRLIVQPIVDDGSGGLQVLDIAAHLIFSFTSGRDTPAQPGCFPRPIPDMAKVKAIAVDAKDLRTRLANGQIRGTAIQTKGKPLGLHPAFKSAATSTGFRSEVLAFLNKHLPQAQLTSMAVAGLPDDFGEPWMFLAMFENPPGSGQFTPAPSPALGFEQFPERKFAEALSFLTDKNVLPTPAPNNLAAITCQHSALAAPLPVAGRKGVATSELFDGEVPKERARQIVDIIGNPAQSHFFNADCVSCHTDTRLGIDLLGLGTFTGIDKDALPKSQWNVRNFGWFPDQGPTATNRTLQESLESLAEFNRLLEVQ